MWDLVAALGLVLAVEGILFAAFPNAMKRAMDEAAKTPVDRVRIVGLIGAVFGVAVVWAARG